jgi:ribosomal protein S18 acetylase RimI-like enzyme
MILRLTCSALERTLLALEERYLALISPERSVDPKRLAHYLTSVVECFPFSDFPNYWFLSTVAVDPSCQRRGIGQQLVEWGLQQARQENLPVGLEASIKGFGLYEKLGFRTVNKMELMPGITIRAMLHDGDSLPDKVG